MEMSTMQVNIYLFRITFGYIYMWEVQLCWLNKMPPPAKLSILPLFLYSYRQYTHIIYSLHGYIQSQKCITSVLLLWGNYISDWELTTVW